MKYVDKIRLRKLLEDLPNVPKDFDSFMSSGKVPAYELLEIYTRRKETAGDRYSGFNQVLEALVCSGSTSIKVLSLEVDGKLFLFFTDAKVRNLLGTLAEV